MFEIPLQFLKILCIYLCLETEKRGGRKRGRETSMCNRNTHWLSLTRPQPGAPPVTQACVLTLNQTATFRFFAIFKNPYNISR